MKLSLCIATFNEEASIHYPLNSLIDIVDEVVIVDGGSADKTVERALSYGEKVRVIKTDNPPLFHINKQKALDHARGDWILQLDADEEVSPPLKDEILRVIAVENLTPVAYWLPRKNFFLKRFLEKGGQYPDYTLRLYRRGYARLPCKSVHENAEVLKTPGGEPISDAEESRYVGKLTHPLLHYADPDFSRYLMRWNRYSSLDAGQIIKRNEQISFVHYFFVQPVVTFFLMYFRHKGFQDGFPGFVFALFSSLRFWVIYIKVWSGVKS